MNKQETKKTILDVGMKLVLENGYNHTGLNEVLAAADVPKGSFYYYFSSKEEFGLALIQQFEQANNQILQQYLTDKDYDPLTRLRRYFQFNVDFLVSLDCRQGCLVGNLGQEMSDQSDTFRLRVKEVMDGWASSLAVCLLEAQQQGQIGSHLDTQELAKFCLNSWQGSILMMKVTKDRGPLDLFLQTLFQVILK